MQAGTHRLSALQAPSKHHQLCSCASEDRNECVVCDCQCGANATRVRACVHVCVGVCVCRWVADMQARETPECLGATARQAKTELRVQRRTGIPEGCKGCLSASPACGPSTCRLARPRRNVYAMGSDEAARPPREHRGDRHACSTLHPIWPFCVSGCAAWSCR